MAAKSLPCLLGALVASSALAAKPTFTFKPPPDEERPVVVSATVKPQGSDYAFQLLFDREPFGDECKNRCANVTLLLDTDGSRESGLKGEKNAAEAGADLAVVIQGQRQYADEGGKSVLKVKVVEISTGLESIQDGSTLVEMDQQRDTERVLSDGKTLFLLIDATSSTLPSARKGRIIYRPPGSKAIVAPIAGLGAGASKGKARIFRNGP